MEVDLAMLADAATIDGSGKLNILGIFDRLNASTFPVRHPRLVLILRFAAGLQEVGKHQVEITLRDPDGGEVVRLDGEMKLGPGPSSVTEGVRVPHLLHMDGLVFERGGRYGFDVRVDGEHQVTIPLLVTGPSAVARA